ncbi:E3 ubiquitin-protein ligase DZIP3 [Exaiptasia diaphana]|nr:E3 ubiquitin-protein ligase DZIP3 [Exaiptasia diaphana]
MPKSAPPTPPPPPPIPPPPPQPATTSSSTPRQKNNYTRLSRLLIDIGTRVLRGVFDSLVLHLNGDLRKHLHSTAVHNKLKTLKNKGVLRVKQWVKLYPTAPGVPSSSTFDITLLFLLLRNTCGLTAPTTGWNAAPPPADISKEADLIRVKECRNEITGHSPEAKLSDIEFETQWVEIKPALLRLAHSYRHVSDYGTQIERLKEIESMDPLNEADLNILLQSWEEGEEKKMEIIIQKLKKISMQLPSENL